MSPPDEHRNGAALRDGARVVVRAGQPTPEELAALVTALDAADDGRSGDDGPHPAPRGSPWQRAARLEAAGAGRLATPADLELGSRPRPVWP